MQILQLLSLSALALVAAAGVAANVKHLSSADGTAVYAEAVGNPLNPHIVFLHGLALTNVVFDRIFHDADYAEKYYLVRYDMRGHGRSGHPQDAEAYESERLAQDFAAVVDGYNLKTPVFVGWSFGGTVFCPCYYCYSLAN